MTSRVVAVGLLACALALVAQEPARAQGSGEPYELVRSLQSLQDQVARGNAAAHAQQSALMARITDQFARMKPEAWKEPRNARAAVVFVLSGGSSRVLQQLLDSGTPYDLDERLVKGALAYASGKREQAAELLLSVDARSLDAAIAGYVAYAQAELAAPKDTAKALAYFDDARLLAPGTLIEEAALRRQIALIAAGEGGNGYGRLAIQYLRRFPSSIYAASFRQEFAEHLATGPQAGDQENLARLEGMLSGLARAERLPLWLSVAKVALHRGRVAISKFAAEAAIGLAQPGSRDASLSHLILAASLVATGEAAKGAEMIAAIERGHLGADEMALIDAALAVAEQVQRPVPPLPPLATDVFAGSAGERADTKGDPSASAMTRARDAVARVDQMLSGASQ